MPSWMLKKKLNKISFHNEYIFIFIFFRKASSPGMQQFNNFQGNNSNYYMQTANAESGD